MEMIIYCGIQASGKSSFYKESHFNTHVRISMDLLNTRNKENKFIKTCLETQQAFVVDNTNPTKLDRLKYIEIAKAYSILAGEASAKFSSILGDVAAFDCRISELPNSLLVEDYFRWRNEDAHRNALNAHCYWNLRQNGYNKNEAIKRIEGLSVSMKNELLHTYGINFNDLPNWQKRGIGIYWENVKSTGINPLSNEIVEVIRRQLTADMELPMGDAYNRYIAELIQKNEDL